MKKGITTLLASFFTAFLFGIGLEVSHMTDPQKVRNFLNLFFEWDPSLILVMVGAIIVYSALYSIIVKRPRPVCETQFEIPKRKDLDRKLFGGAALFGIGWGLGGFCPGPAVVSLYRGQIEIVFFVISMLVGMLIFQIMQKNNG